MYKRLKNMELGTIMVAVLFAQQLFGVYHVFSSHLNDFPSEFNDGQALISDIETQCDLCAKLNIPAATLDFDQNITFPTSEFPSIVAEETGLLLANGFLPVFQRGPPASV